MSGKSEAWRAGYAEGWKPRTELLAAIEPPRNYTDEQRGDFISGFLAGIRNRRDADLLDELDAAITGEAS